MTEPKTASSQRASTHKGKKLYRLTAGLSPAKLFVVDRRQDIVSNLRLHSPLILRTGFNRPNIFYEVRTPPTRTLPCSRRPLQPPLPRAYSDGAAGAAVMAALLDGRSSRRMMSKPA